MLVSSYQSYEENPAPTKELMDTVNFAHSKEMDIVIGCDANAHHLLWGSTNDNNRGESFLNYLSTTYLFVVNKGNKPTFINKNRKEEFKLGKRKFAFTPSA